MSSQKKHIAIAIDGPAASGKSSVALRLAKLLGYTFVNSGAMYRAFTWSVLESGLRPQDTEDVVDHLSRCSLDCVVRGGKSVPNINGRELDRELSDDQVNQYVSTIAAIPAVRQRMVAEQRRYRKRDNVVMEGRDIGTVVLPDTPHKFYLDAKPEVRIERRAAQGIQDDVRGRDDQDRARETSPLAIAEDAQVIDTSELNLDQVVGHIAKILSRRGIDAKNSTGLRPMTPVYRLCYTACKLLHTGLYHTEIHHGENARVPGGAFIASNHESYFDPPLVGTCLEEPIYYLARKTLFGNALASWLLPRLNAVPLDQERSDLSALRLAIQLVTEGKKLVVFPEGQRSRSGQLGSAQRGVGLLIAKTGVPVIPVRVFGAYDIFPREASMPRLHGKIHVSFGKAFTFSEEQRASKGKAGAQAIADRVMAAIAAIPHPDSE